LVGCKHFFTGLFIVIVVSLFLQTNIYAEQLYEERLALYHKTASGTNIPWYYLAAFDQYERNIQKDKADELIAISFPAELWYGPGNINLDDNAATIELFGGIGLDGNGDGKANSQDPEDILITAAQLLTQNGVTEDDIKISLWHHYKRDLSVKTVTN